MRQRHTPSFLNVLLLSALLPVCLSQTTVIQVGQGAPSDTIRNEYQVAYQRSEFFNFVAPTPLTEVVTYGSGGYRQEFQDAAKTGVKSALVRPAAPDLTVGANNAVRQVRAPIYAIYTQSSIGSAVAGFPNMDTARFSSTPLNGGNVSIGGSYQIFDKNFAIFLWDSPPNDGGTATQFNISDPIFTRWKTIGFDSIGPPYLPVTAVTSRFGTKGSYQVYGNGAIYNLTSGTFSGRVIYVRKSVQDLYDSNLGPAGFLGLPLSDETILSNGRRQQSFEGGTIEYALTGTPVLKNAIATITLNGDNPLRLSVGQTANIEATLITSAGETAVDRDVFWTTTNGKVATITGTGPKVSIRAVGGGTALVTATSEGKSSAPVTIFVASQCCALGEGAPTLVITQTFIDAAQRNRLTLRAPLATPVRRAGGGYAQEAIALPGGYRVVIAKADTSPVAYVLSGPLLATVDALGGVPGALGYPVSDASAGGVQLFENGALGGSPVRYVGGAILSRWVALGRETGTVGAPLAESTTGITFNGTSVTSQVFRGGALFALNSGAMQGKTFLVSGVILAKYSELGLIPGTIGAPLSDEFQTATASRQEFEGAFLEYPPGGAVRLIDKARKPSLTVSPSALLPGGRYRVTIGGFAPNTRIRVTTGTGASADAFDSVAANGSYLWDSILPANARAGVTVIRATDLNNAQSFAEGSYTVRALADLKPTVSKVSGDSQAGAPATILASALRVSIRDSAGNAIPGVAVRAEASPGAIIVSASAATAADGTADIRLRLPAQAGVALVTVDVGGQLVTFTARAAAQLPTDFPRITQAVEGTYANSTTTLAQKGALLAAMAGVVRFYQQRGLVPADSGFADTVVLNSYLRAFCSVDAGGKSICDGFLDSAADPQPNPFRVLNFAAGALDLVVVDPNLGAIRDLAGNGTPVIVALELARNGVAAGAHFVTAYGVTATGDLAIADSNPQFGFTLLSQYTGGFPAGGGNWTAKLVGGLVYTPTGSVSNAFFVSGGVAFQIASSGTACSPAIEWAASFASVVSSGVAGVFRLQSCDGTAGAYQLSVPEGAYQLQLTSLGNPVARTVLAGVAATGFLVARTNGDSWTAAPQELNLSAANVLNAASFSARLGVGAIVSIFGSGLPLTTAGGSIVELNGVTLPLFFSNGFQLNAAIPSTLIAGSYPLHLRSAFGDLTVPLEIETIAPGLFLLDSRRSAAVLNQDNTINSAGNPAIRGQAIVIFVTGLGAVTRQSNGLSTANAPVTAVVNGRELTPFFSGLAPGYIGLYQLNVMLPVNLPPGVEQSLVVRAGGVDSNAGIISVR